MTAYRRFAAELNEKDAGLSAANEQLRDQLGQIGEASAAKERKRIGQEIHDTLGHTMTLLIALLEVCAITCEQNPAETRQKLQEAIRVAKEGLKELRHAISRKTEIINLLDSLRQLSSGFPASGMLVDFSVEGVRDDIQPRVSEAIYRICQEALTNALRHGKAKQATIILRFNPQTVNLYIFDNGRGCQTITKGMGLNGMEERVKELKGIIEYGSSGESGFNINVEIPLTLT